MNQASRPRIGIVGYRGMVGSVLIERMIAENDFSVFEPVLLSSSQAGRDAPEEVASFMSDARILSANDLRLLMKLPAIITCQGSGYTQEILSKLREQGWSGFWIDAASLLRGKQTSVLVLDPINAEQIRAAVESGCRDLIGANCTVSLMLMAIHGLVAKDLVQEIWTSTYQAISGAGAGALRELFQQMESLSLASRGAGEFSLSAACAQVEAAIASPRFPKDEIGAALAGSLLPWIDSDLGSGMSREEQKGYDEVNRLLGRSEDQSIPVESTCVRVPVLRCHSQSLTLMLKEDLPLSAVEALVRDGSEWIDFVPNTRNDSLTRLTPTALSGTLRIGVGRLRKVSHRPATYTLFTCGDQLLWGAAEPLRRVLRLLAQWGSFRQ